MSEDQGSISAGVIDNGSADDVEVTDRATLDQERIEQWHQANAEAPTRADVKRAIRDVQDAEKMLAQAHEALAKAAAHRATVHGWVPVAEEVGVSAKRIHAWRKEHCPELPDLSTIPEREMKREARRVESEEREIEKVEELRKRVAERKARLAAGTIENGEQA